MRKREKPKKNATMKVPTNWLWTGLPRDQFGTLAAQALVATSSRRDHDAVSLPHKCLSA